MEQQFHDGDIVTLPQYPRTRFCLSEVTDTRARFLPVKKDGTRDRRWDVGFSGSVQVPGICVIERG